jgi:hypothetical protein
MAKPLRLLLTLLAGWIGMRIACVCFLEPQLLPPPPRHAQWAVAHRAPMGMGEVARRGAARRGAARASSMPMIGEAISQPSLNAHPITGLPNKPTHETAGTTTTPMTIILQTSTITAPPPPPNALTPALWDMPNQSAAIAPVPSLSRPVPMASVPQHPSPTHTTALWDMPNAPALHNPPRKLVQALPEPAPPPALALAQSPTKSTPPPPAKTQASPHISFDSWTLLRQSSAPALNTAGELGGAQTGFRASTWIKRKSGWPAIALTSRSISPLGSALGKESSFGIAMRPLSAVTLIAEQRLAFDAGGVSKPQFLAAAGVYGQRLPAHFILNAYAEAGLVGLAHAQGFGDGAAHIEHQLLALGTSRVSFGAGTWAGAQQRLTRLDLGPELNIKTHVYGLSLLTSASYRFRIMGNARPMTSPALTLAISK